MPGAPPARVQRITVLAPTSNDPKRWSQIRLMALAVVAIWMLPAAVLCWLFSPEFGGWDGLVTMLRRRDLVVCCNGAVPDARM